MAPLADAPSMLRIEQLRVDCIVVGERLRPLSEPTVAALAQSIEVNGLVSPITIRRPHGSMVPRLLAGAHRLEAVKRLGWTVIPCLVAPHDDDDRAALTEIDENLIRRDLSPAERAVHIDKRKQIYEPLNPETQHGAVGRGGKTDPNLGSFSADTAARTGRSRSSVAQDATPAKKILRIADVIGTSLDKGDELDALSKLPLQRQELLIAKARTGGRISAKPEVKKVRRAERKRELAVSTEQASRALGIKLYGSSTPTRPGDLSPTRATPAWIARRTTITRL